MRLELSAQEFLDSLPSKGTRKVYKYGLNKFLEWYGKTAKEVLEERKDNLTQRPNEDIVTYRNRAANYERIIESFYNHLIEKGYKINAAKSITHGIRQLLRFYHMDVRMRSGSNVNRTVKTQKRCGLMTDQEISLANPIPVRSQFNKPDLPAGELPWDWGLKTSSRTL